MLYDPKEKKEETKEMTKESKNGSDKESSPLKTLKELFLQTFSITL
jgi:hypothetical protein